MKNVTRRTALRLFGAAVATSTVGSTGALAEAPKRGSVRKLGHSLLSDPPGGYTEEDVRSDGQYAVVGSFFGTGGSFLVDISNPRNPTEVHSLPSSSTVRNADVAFDPRDGLYYRSQEPNASDAEFAGTEIVDYGFGDSSPEEPAVLAEIDAGPTHNLFPHPDEPLLYTVNEHNGTSAFDVWDVSDPANPEMVTEVGPTGGLHDIVVDPERDLAHAAFISDALDNFDPDRDFAGYLVYDVSDPWNPSEVGRFDYTGRSGYTEERLRSGEPGFSGCHYANYDPRRGIAVVGDEIGFGVPGGKHVFDVGWGDGSPSDPQHVGFTYSPNAEIMDEGDEVFDWTGHNFDVVPKGDTTLLASGDYHEGAVVYDITDPTDPTPTDQYRTVDGAEDANGPLFGGAIGDPPMAWGVDYAAERDIGVVSDMVTGIYTFRFTADASGTKGGR